MRDIDLSGSALYIKICLNTSATLIMNKCLNESCLCCCRSMACNSLNLAPLFEKEKMTANGGNYEDWIHTLRFVLRSAKKEYVLDQLLGATPTLGASQDIISVYLSRKSIMLSCMHKVL